MKQPTGVFQAQKKDGSIYYRASITFHAKHISLGSYAKSDEAHQVYLDAAALLNATSHLTPEEYAQIKTSLPFLKWVILTNFKNNGIYSKTPIYLRNRFFHYYLSMNDILTFDIDDLFYYSTHSIMRRGNHLFVADYGMQVNILSRYGIKNFAVANRDFRFINGDSHDFRYNNIEIINRFHGVTRKQEKNKTIYIAKIHIHGDYIIGKYETDILAAIAYNKAADLLKKKGVTKQFPQNYIEELSASSYVQYYTDVSISDKILNFIP